jgi:hypothetical protein
MPNMSEATPAAGWYANPEVENQLSYWDGFAWMSHSASQAAHPPPVIERVATHSCPYCGSSMPRNASWCGGCGGELKFCSRCSGHVGTHSKQKFDATAPEGVKMQYRCMRCHRVVEGPGF